jgi:hypothetical protein
MNITTPFFSILFLRREDQQTPATEPAFFRDLNLDQIVRAITMGSSQYDLKPFFMSHYIRETQSNIGSKYSGILKTPL